MRAWVQEQQSGPITLQENYPIPTVEPHEIKIKVSAVAINPVDFKLIDYGLWNQTWPRVAFGCDVAGIIEEVGDEVEGFSVGDEVYGCTDLFNVKSGTFGEYSVTRPEGIYKKPSNVSFETASGFGVSILTSYLSFSTMGLLSGPTSDAFEDKTVFVWGGGSSVGFYAIQILALLGYDVLTSASREFEKLIALGAKQVFNYKDEDVIDQIKAATGGKLQYIYDTASDAHISSKIGRTDGPVTIATIAAYDTSLVYPDNVTPHAVFIGGGFNDPVVRASYPGFLESTNKLVESESLVYLQELKFNTIESIEEALQTLREGVTISKVVVTF